MVESTQPFATRLNSFRHGVGDAASVANAIRSVAAVPGITAVELNVPQHLSLDRGVGALKLAAELGLAVTALNLRFDGPEFIHGAFTHPVEANRQRAIDLCRSAIDLAGAHGIAHVILWMGPDGFDYPFQADIARLWEQEIDGFRQVCDHDSAIRVSVEYKPSDPRRMSLIRGMADSLLAVIDVDRANFGVTLDVCHALMAGESPAASAALALRRGRLFGVHLNDGYGPADDGMMVGSVHHWQTLELLWTLREHAFDGTLYFDTFPDRVDPATECRTNIQQVLRLQRVLDRIDRDQLRELQSRQDAVGVTRMLQSLLFETGS